MAFTYSPTPEAAYRLSNETRRALYEVIALRRDIRHFEPEGEIDADVLSRVLEAAHAAPSVGLSQPWGFILVRDRARRERIRSSFQSCREAEAEHFAEPRRADYLALKLEGIVESTLNICVVADLRTREEVVLGTTAQPSMLRASVCCAVQNLWLAARAEGIGVGWVSIVSADVIAQELALPLGVEPVAYLCVGVPRAFRIAPMLEEVRWASRRPLESAIHDETWVERRGR